MLFSKFRDEKGVFIQKTGHQPDHCLIHPDDAQELINTAEHHGRIVEKKVEGVLIKTHAMIDGVPVLMRDDQTKGQPKFETRERLPYEPPPAYMKPRKPRQQ